MIIGDQAAAGGSETLSAEPEHVDVGLAATQRVNQRARVQVTGGLAAGQQEARAQEVRLPIVKVRPPGRVDGMRFRL